jgi:hypothetical protein
MRKAIILMATLGILAGLVFGSLPAMAKGAPAAGFAATQEIVATPNLILVSDTTNKTAGYTTTDPAADPLKIGNYSQHKFGYAAVVNDGSAAWVTPATLDPNAAWISSAAVREDQGQDSWRLLRKLFYIPPSANDISGYLQYSVDNAVAIYVNGQLVETTGTVYGPVTDQSQHYYSQILSLDITSQLKTGANTLQFVVRNWNLDAGNPTGLLYKASFSWDHPNTTSNKVNIVKVSNVLTKTAGYTETDPSASPLDPTLYSKGKFVGAKVVTDGYDWISAISLYKKIEWISSAAQVEDNNADSWRLFERALTIPDGVTVLTGTVRYAADNAVAIYVNGQQVATTGDVFGPATDQSHLNYQTISGPIDIKPYLHSGANTVDFVVRNWANTSANPTGLLYKVNLSYTKPQDGQLSGAAEITAYSLPGETGPAVIDNAAGTIAVTVPHDADVTGLAATFTTSANISSIKVGGMAQVSGATTNDFSNPVAYVVTAENGTHTKTYTVTVTKAAAPLSSDATLGGLSLSTGTLNPSFASGTTSYTAGVANSVSAVTVTPTVNESHATVTVNGGSPSTPVTLSVGANTIAILVTAQNGTTNTYTVTVTRSVPLSSAAELTSFSVPKQKGDAIIDSAAGTIYIEVNRGNDINWEAMVATFTFSAHVSSVTVGGVTQVSGVTANNFIQPVTYVVTAQDGTVKNWVITIVEK